ncbi:hypothetical protein ACJA28_02235 [Mesomycoplasma moatsii]|uniref:hypothetical protein n=1 Tax=Mesomycoplasma moatsii TaxID=171287 RepID=UPI0003B67F77
MINNKKKNEKDKTLLVSDFNNSVEQIVEYYLLNEYTNLSKKILKSKVIFIFMNLISFLMSTTIVILTMFVIGKEIGGKNIQMIFVSISIITSTITFIVGLDGIFRFKKRKEIYLRRISELNNFLDYIDKNYQDKKNVKEIVIKVSEKLHELENDQIT